jgi:hypothetical protein
VTRDEATAQAIHDAIQNNASPGEGFILTGWTLVAEWEPMEGDRQLARWRLPSMTPWAAKSLHHEALYGDWEDG